MQYESLFNKIRSGQLDGAEARKAITQQLDEGRKENFLYKETVALLKSVLSSIIKVPVERIDEDMEFDEIGINSIMIMDMTEELEHTFANVSQTLFYEYNNLSGLASYFINNYKDTLIKLFEEENGDREEKAEEIQVVDCLLEKEEQVKKADVRKNISQDIAIIGISGRYPESDTLDEFWENLKNGRDCIREIPKDRWDYEAYYSSEKKPGTVNSKWGGFLKNIDEFDPLIFHISPIEADRMDPQERLFLQCAYHLFEDAGYNKNKLGHQGKVGVYVGVMYEEYQFYGVEEQKEGNSIALGGNASSIANRVSYIFNLHGPSIALNTMCSSSLTTIHLACQSIKGGECDMAVAGGVNISVHPNKYITLGQGNFASSKGKCESFGANGDGYVPGEGVGAVLLKPLSKAIEDRDHIYGIIKGTAVNHGGKTNGYTVPNPNMQAEVIESALKQANMNPRTVSFIEAHGTGTILGDPIEIAGLEKVFKKYSDDTKYCAIGSVKSNIGHCEGAAGIAAVTKTLLQMKHQKIVPSLHSNELNSKIDFEHSPFVVQQTLEDWKQPVIIENEKAVKYPRRAGISAFGAGGSNAHVILEEFDDSCEEVYKDDMEKKIVVISARTRESVQSMCKGLLEALNKNTYKEEDLARIAYTLQTGREELEIRTGFVVASIAELKERIEHFLQMNADKEWDLYEATENQLTKKEADVYQVESLIRKKQYEELLNLWKTGCKIAWDAMYPEDKPNKISLPLYPFSNKKYWYKKRTEISQCQKREEAKLFIPSWEECQEVSDVLQSQKQGGRTLIVYCMSVTEIAKKIESYYCSQGIVSTYMLWNENSDYSAIQNEEFDTAYFVSDITTKDEEAINQNAVQFLAFSKELKKYSKKKGKIDCYVLTFNAYKREENQINLADGTITGITYALAQSSDDLSVRNIDMSIQDVFNDVDADLLVKSIAQIKPSKSGEVIKLEKGKTYKQKFLRLYEMKQESFSSDGVYVILGGTGTVGSILTSYLIKENQANVVWIGRKDKNDADVMKKIETCTYQGKQPGYVQADATDLNQLLCAVEQIKASYGKIRGAVFSGVVFDIHNEIATTTREQFLKILNVKTSGSMNFYKAFEQEKLDFLVYFSSGQSFSFSPAGNLCAYAAGITFTDTYVRYLAKKAPFPVGSINWGFWKSSVSEAFGKNLNNCIDDEQGWNMFVKAVSALRQQGISQVVCMDLEKIIGIEPESVMQKLSAQYDTRDFEEKYRMQLEFPEDLESAIKKVLFVQTRAFLKKTVIKKYVLWMEECRRILAESEETMAYETEPIDTVWKEWEQIVEVYRQKEDYKATIILLDKCLRNLPDILSEKTAATDIIFPNGSMELVEDIYSHNVIEDFYNSVLAEYVENYMNEVHRQNKDRNIKILEIGAGTGGTSGVVLKKLAPFKHNVEYYYTDISNSFLLFAQDKFASYKDFMKFKIWNVEEGYKGKEKFDLIVATNVLHSTVNMKRTLCNIGHVMNKKGILLVNEITEKNLAETLTFGLLDGWWKFDDPDCRILGSPLLSNENWKTVLHECEFPRVMLPLEHSDKVKQQIILAEYDGKEQEISVEPVEATDEKYNMQANPRNLNSSTKNSMDMELQCKQDNTDRREQLLSDIKLILCKILNLDIDEVKDNGAFSDYGLDSILGSTFITKLNEVFHTELNNAILFDYTTSSYLADYLLDRYSDQIAAKYGAAAEVKPVIVPSKRQEACNQEVQQEASKEYARETDSKIAVIGMSGQFPDALNVWELWDNLVDNSNCVHELTKEYLDIENFYDEVQQNGKTYCKWGGTLEQKEYFEPLFFNIAPRDAENMSVHQRLILQEGWKAIEDAGYNPYELSESQTGVFIGAEPVQTKGEAFVGSSDAIVSSRLSYLLNLQGPSLTINTGCSSSAAAIHIACENLRNGSVDLALAGGIYADLNQQSLIALSKIGMLSKTGRCHTFDDQADGTVMSEGVGIVVLKRLEDAIRDKDAIYGVIQASGMNQDGASNGITAPNGIAQEKLIRSIYEKAEIDPEDISYIETHGTGTKLGDPVEFNALDRVFAGHLDGEKKCILGSVKTNIGHTGAASGVIGLIKVLLCMKYKKIPAIHGLEKVNSLIDLEHSMFEINTEIQEWTSDAKFRLAGINSFGHSGTNVHIVVEEYKEQQEEKSAVEDWFIPVSADSRESLKRYCINLSAWIERNAENTSLQKVAYTMQNSRKSRKVRALFVVKSMDELKEKLRKFVDSGEKEIENCWYNNLKNEKNALDFIGADQDMKQVVLKWYQKGLYSQIAKLWIMGNDVDWKDLYGVYGKEHLPSYAFDLERYSIVKADLNSSISTSRLGLQRTGRSLLVQENCSDFENYKFCSVFTGKEEFLRDHVINENKVFPGTAYLEMVNEAYQALMKGNKENSQVELKQVVWVSPLIIESRTDVEIVLEKKESSSARYQIMQGDRILNQGFVSAVPKENRKINLDGIKERCQLNYLSGKECYNEFEKAGFVYGETFRGIQELYFGGKEALARINLEKDSNYLVSPGMLDSALQTVAGLRCQEKANSSLPYVMEKCIIRRTAGEEMWAYVTSIEDERTGKCTYQIEICDVQGKSCISISGYQMRVSPNVKPCGVNKGEELLLMETYMDEWNSSSYDEEIDTQIAVITDFAYQNYLTPLQRESMKWIRLTFNQACEAEQYQSYACQLIEKLQQVLQKNTKERVLIRFFYGQKESYCQGLAAIIKTAKWEHPNVLWESICMGCNGNEISAIGQGVISPGHEIALLQNNRIEAKQYREVKPKSESFVPWKNGGVYLISGGAGKLGMIFAKDIVTKANNTTVILLGRSDLSQSRYNEIADLNQNGATVVYYQIDITNQVAVNQVFENIKSEYGIVNGILHCAGIIRDSLLLNANLEDCKRVIDVKAKGFMNLHKASENVDLDFFVSFSSYAGAFGNSGQAAYSAANAFLDQMTVIRNRLVKQKKCYGKTISINWPFWEEGGMKASKEKLEQMYQHTGMCPLRTKNALQAFYDCVNRLEGQVIVLQGDKNKMKEVLFKKHVIEKRKSEVQSVPGKALKRDGLSDKMKEMVAEIIRVKVEDVDSTAEFSEYGFDSVTYTEFSNLLNDAYQIHLIPTVFYEYNSIEKLCDYIEQEFSVTELEEKETVMQEDVAFDMEESVEEQETQQDERKTGRAEAEPEEMESVEQHDQRIAIVGMSARFPGAEDINAYWDNLKAGKESISEIPKERWDWREYYGDPKKEPGKTNVKWGGFIDGVDEFDPLFFEISPKQAELMDPKQRLILEYAWKAIEDAGYAPSELAGSKTGVFVGTGAGEYGSIIGKSVNIKDGYSVVGNASAMEPNRVSFFMDFHGPSEPVDTACSSSLIAVHRAVRAIQDGECESALVGGCNTILTPDLHIGFSKSNMLSVDGHCKTFSDKADGYVRGEGIGVIYLKKLEKAIEDRDHIYGVIIGTSENHGGRANSITAPNPVAQRMVIKEAYKNAKVHPSTITYIEAHGTGTELGDPIEYNSLCEVFQEDFENLKPVNNKMGCGIGSVKTNIGHLEFASGIAGLIKVLLQFQNKTIVKTLNCDTVNPYLKTESSNFYIAKETHPWLQIEDDNMQYIPRRAGISSFGFGGANAHIVLEEFEAEQRQEKAECKDIYWFPFSAKTENSLRMMLSKFIALIDAGKLLETAIGDIAYTLQCGREQMQERLLVGTASLMDLSSKLKLFLESEGEIRTYYETEPDSYWKEQIQNWTKGKKVTWEQKGKGRRISLPTYEFERKSYWVTEQFSKNTKEMNEIFGVYRKKWKIKKKNVIISSRKGIALIFCTNKTELLAKEIFLPTQISPVLLVHDIDGCKNENTYRADFYSELSCEQAYERLKTILADNELAGIVDVTAYDREYESNIKVENGKLLLLQKFMEEYGKTNIRLLQVTHLLQNTENTKATMFGSRTYGLYKMLQAEYKYIQASVMDSDIEFTRQEELANQIKEEFFNKEREVSECVYRGENRYIPVIEMCHSVRKAELRKAKYYTDDVILITGGLGGIGRVICDKLIEQKNTKIVLLGREKLPNVVDGKLQRNRNDMSIVSEKEEQISKWESKGAEIYYYDADLSDLESLEKVADCIREKAGKVKALFHCAGLTGRNPIFHRKNIDDICQICEPKLQGVHNLAHVLKEDSLSYFIMFSSIASVSPKLAAGISDYALANSYMNCFAQAKENFEGTYCKALQWPIWNHIGMSQDVAGSWDKMGIPVLDKEDAVELLFYMLEEKVEGSIPSRIIRKQDMDSLLELPSVKCQEKNETANDENKEAVMQRIRDWTRKLFVEELKIEEKQLDDNILFEEYGVDSIVIAQLVDTMKNELDVKLPSSLLIENRTLNELNQYLFENHGSYFEGAAVNPVQESFKKEENKRDKVIPEKREGSEQEELAIVGIACRFPGSGTKEEFWNNLLKGNVMIKEKPVQRWSGKEDRKDYGGWLENTSLFDADYFGINRNDAVVMDPQARVVLEESLKAIYDAGYECEEIKGKNAGVYIGGRGHQSTDLDTILSANNPILGMGNNYMASNISRYFDFRGPCMVVDTACSSGITALMMAGEALKQRKIDFAVVGAVSLLDDSLAHDVFEKRNILSRDGVFRIFDKHETGDVLGEGCGVVVVKRLCDAVDDGNHIYGVVKGIGVNNNGRTLGPGSPNIEAQKEVMKQALHEAGKTPDEIEFLEVNGAGTVMMDAVEIKAVSEIYGLNNLELGRCAIGSVKPNIGHLLLASGMASFIRCLLSISKKEIPPFLSAKSVFDEYDFEHSRVLFNRETMVWESSKNKRCAAMNVFPDGGTNYHVIVEEFIPDSNYKEKVTVKIPPRLQPWDCAMKADSSEVLENQSVWGGLKW